jgi:hypothetical protein
MKTQLSDEIQAQILTNKAIEIGLIGKDQLKYPVVVKYGKNDQGKTRHATHKNSVPGRVFCLYIFIVTC